MKLIVGLGNPGREYLQTRHNIGFIVIDKILAEQNLELKISTKHHSAYVKAIIDGESVIIAKPLTYMNLSGRAVSSLANYYKVETKNILIISDDLALPIGKIRLREKGSAGGQKGLQDIIRVLGTNEVKRLRVGIGENQLIDKVDYVLGKISNKELEVLMPTFENCYYAIHDWIKNDNFMDIMNKYNSPQT